MSFLAKFMHFLFITNSLPMEKEKAIIKFNGGNLALLCSNCRVIIKSGKDFTKEESDFVMIEDAHLDPQYCDDCKLKPKDD